MRIENWIEYILYRAREMSELVKEMDNCKIDVCAVQEIRWLGKETVIKIII
jgi:hypothetical protein